jgi:hypothetical protein
MAAEVPRSSTDDECETLKLADALTHVLDECRMVLPGIQALFGFQMIAVFNEGFSRKLSAGEQKLHIAAIVLVVAAIALLMAPAALHREAEPKMASDRFLRVSTRLLLAAMVPLAVSIAAEVFIVTEMVCHDFVTAVSVAMAVGVLFVVLWFVYPIIYRRTA